MTIATLTTKGQVTVPKDIRVKLHLEAGEKVEFRWDEKNGSATMVPLNKKVQDVFGILQRTSRKKPVMIEDMDQAVRERFRREHS